jgi:DNA invertase Pin-like site-specific DNA recombinase
MNAYAYGRMGSKSQTLAMQRAALERAAARGDSLVWFEEHASGRTIDRRELSAECRTRRNTMKAMVEITSIAQETP